MKRSKKYNSLVNGLALEKTPIISIILSCETRSQLYNCMKWTDQLFKKWLNKADVLDSYEWIDFSDLLWATFNKYQQHINKKLDYESSRGI